MSRLKYGGMELSLINFINKSNITNRYNVNLYLAYTLNKELLDQINKKVNIHLLCTGKWNLINKIRAFFKLIIMYIFNEKSDVSICYTNHQRILSKLSRRSSKNSILFVHSDLNRYINASDKAKIKNKIKFDKFSKIICVSEKVKESLINLYDKKKEKKCYVVANYIDGDKIIKLSKKNPNISIKNNIPTFINIANHVEEFKNINAIIESAKKLKEDEEIFQILLIGSGKDTDNYKTKIAEYKLEDIVLLLGSKSNPYPYLKKGNALLFPSKYEGYGMVLDEARVLGIPIISTGSGASAEICNAGYGILTNDLYSAMKKIIKNKNTFKKNFDYEKHNQQITNMYDQIIN